jgi:TIR domain
MRIFISHRRGLNSEGARLLCERIAARFGRDAILMDVDAIQPGQDFSDDLKHKFSSSEAMLVIIDKGWLDARDSSGARRLDDPNDVVRREIATALTTGIPVVPVLVEGAKMPAAAQLPQEIRGLVLRQAFQVVPGGNGNIGQLLDQISARSTSPPAPAPKSVQGIIRRAWHTISTIVRPESQSGSSPPAGSPDPRAPRPAPKRARPVPPAPAAAAPPEPAVVPSAAQSSVPAEPEVAAVLLGVSAPRRLAPGETASARFVAYVEALEERVRKQLEELGGDEERSALGISPDRAARWKVGTPVTVRLDGGPHISVRPAEASFEWNGRSNLVSFALAVVPAIPARHVQLKFEAFIEGIPVAFIPIDVAVAQAADPTPATVSGRPATTAFASYSSLDAQQVALCLSALSRWDAGLTIFMDCLDLKPNEPWRRELERVIPKQDSFLLFWSANAMKSKWVDWEWRHASATKGIDVIRPFPLEDPAVAPPPMELEHLHFRDRYMMAREALARIAERRS